MCTVYLPMIRRPHYHAITVPKGINSGGPAISLADGKNSRRSALLGTNGAGYIGGQAIESDLSTEPIDGTAEIGSTAPAGRVFPSTVSMFPMGTTWSNCIWPRFASMVPDFRIFDIAVEGRPVVSSLDLYALAQHDYASAIALCGQC